MIIFSMAPQITSYILLNLGHTTKIVVGASDLSSLLKNAGNKVLPGWVQPWAASDPTNQNYQPSVIRPAEVLGLNHKQRSSFPPILI